MARDFIFFNIIRKIYIYFLINLKTSAPENATFSKEQKRVHLNTNFINLSPNDLFKVKANNIMKESCFQYNLEGYLLNLLKI